MNDTIGAVARPRRFLEGAMGKNNASKTATAWFRAMARARVVEGGVARKPTREDAYRMFDQAMTELIESTGGQIGLDTHLAHDGTKHGQMMRAAKFTWLMAYNRQGRRPGAADSYINDSAALQCAREHGKRGAAMAAAKRFYPGATPDELEAHRKRIARKLSEGRDK